jgi:hypothetical protein
MRATLIPALALTATALAGCYDTGPLMRPGENCISCHDGSPAQKWAVAGTVFGCQDADKGDGLNGVRITLTGGEGEGGGWQLTLDSNEAGNFYNAGPIPSTPFNVKVTYDGVDHVMPIQATTGACNSCHTQPPENGAPGRVYAIQAACPVPTADVPASGDL